MSAHRNVVIGIADEGRNDALALTETLSIVHHQADVGQVGPPLHLPQYSSSPSDASFLPETYPCYPYASSPNSSIDSPSPPTSGSSRRRRRNDPDRVRRPCNSFIKFRSYFVNLHKGESSQTNLSRSAGAEWTRMSKDERRPFVQMAADGEQLHKVQHPTYKYAPKQGKGRSKATSSRLKSQASTALKAKNNELLSTSNSQQSLPPVEPIARTTFSGPLPAAFEDVLDSTWASFFESCSLPAFDAGKVEDAASSTCLFPPFLTPMNHQYTADTPYTSAFEDKTAYMALLFPELSLVPDSNACEASMPPYLMHRIPPNHLSHSTSYPLPFGSLYFGTLSSDFFPPDDPVSHGFNSSNSISSNPVPLNHIPLAPLPFGPQNTQDLVNGYDDPSYLSFLLANGWLPYDDISSIDPEIFLSENLPTL